MQFAAAGWLAALGAIPLLYLAVRAADRTAARRAVLLLGPQAPRLREDWRPRARGWRRFCYLAGLTWLVLALARPQWGASEVMVTQRGHDVVVALDVSRSMRAEDVQPSRLERAKSELTAFLRNRTEGRVGLVLFAGAAFVQCPLTSDLATAEIFLQMAEPEMISAQGTALATALRVSRELLQSGRNEGEPGGFQAVLLVTDGEDLEGDWEEEARLCRQEGVLVVPVGIGEQTGGLVPQVDSQGRADGFLRDAQGDLVLSRLDLTTLERLAAVGGGSTFRVGLDGLAGERLRTVLDRLGKRDFEQRQVTRWQERFQWPLALALLHLGLAVAIRPRGDGRRAVATGRTARTPLSSAALGLVLLAGLAPPPAAGAPVIRPDWAEALQRGRTAYAAGDYEAALQEFESARAQAPDEPRLALAVGAALYRLDRHEEAMREFERAGQLDRRPGLQAESLYNAGTAALAAGDLQTAVDRLRRSLRLEPGRTDALHNLEAALLRQQAAAEQESSEQDPQQDRQQDDDAGPGDRDGRDDPGEPDESQGEGSADEEEQPQRPDAGDPSDERRDGDRDASGEPPADDPAADQAEPPAGADPADEPPTMDRDQALGLLQALDRDEQELQRAVQQRLRGAGARSGKEW